MQPAILTTSAIVTSTSQDWPRSINDPHAPNRDLTSAATRVGSILDVIDYLNVEESARYLPRDGKTYCNVYAHDYAWLCGAYLPRVWWTADALEMVADGQPQVAEYGKTVSEVQANDLHDWLQAYGGSFGWKAVNTVRDIQDRANDGRVCVIVARRANRGRSGHITAVVPESEGFRATLSNPVESQAGTTNSDRVVKSVPWWLKAPKFDSFGFWEHA